MIVIHRIKRNVSGDWPCAAGNVVELRLAVGRNKVAQRPFPALLGLYCVAGNARKRALFRLPLAVGPDRTRAPLILSGRNDAT